MLWWYVIYTINSTNHYLRHLSVYIYFLKCGRSVKKILATIMSFRILLVTGGAMRPRDFFCVHRSCLNSINEEESVEIPYTQLDPSFQDFRLRIFFCTSAYVCTCARLLRANNYLPEQTPQKSNPSVKRI